MRLLGRLARVGEPRQHGEGDPIGQARELVNGFEFPAEVVNHDGGAKDPRSFDQAASLLGLAPVGQTNFGCSPVTIRARDLNLRSETLLLGTRPHSREDAIEGGRCHDNGEGLVARASRRIRGRAQESGARRDAGPELVEALR